MTSGQGKTQLSWGSRHQFWAHHPWQRTGLPTAVLTTTHCSDGPCRWAQTLFPFSVHVFCEPWLGAPVKVDTDEWKFSQQHLPGKEAFSRRTKGEWWQQQCWSYWRCTGQFTLRLKLKPIVAMIILRYKEKKNSLIESRTTPWLLSPWRWLMAMFVCVFVPWNPHQKKGMLREGWCLAHTCPASACCRLDTDVNVRRSHAAPGSVF